MRTGILWIGVAAAAVAAGACSGMTEPMLEDGIFTAAEWEKVKSHSPLPTALPVKSNRYADDPNAARLGQKLFFDKGFSGPILVDGSDLGLKGETGKVNCTGCHGPSKAFADSRSMTETSTGTGFIPGRNTLGLSNLGYYDWSAWTGFTDTMWGHAIQAGPECAPCLNTSRLAVARHLYVNYRAEYDALFPTPLDPDLDPAVPDFADGGRRFPQLAPSEYPLGKPTAPDGGVWVRMSPDDQELLNRVVANYGKAIEAYMRKLVSTNSPFDRYVAGDKTAISTSAKRGLKLFIGKAACDECHAGPSFTDNDFHNDGVPERRTADGGLRAERGRYDGINALRARNWLWSSDGPYSDERSGMLATLPLEADGGTAESTIGVFRTKALRSVALTGPFMHTGSMKTLREVVVHYNEGGAPSTSFIGTVDPVLRPLNLTEQEIDDLVAFLESLTGEPLPPALLEPL